jgi:hypothetical protein
MLSRSNDMIAFRVLRALEKHYEDILKNMEGIKEKIVNEYSKDKEKTVEEVKQLSDQNEQIQENK